MMWMCYTFGFHAWTRYTDEEEWPHRSWPCQRRVCKRCNLIEYR